MEVLGIGEGTNEITNRGYSLEGYGCAKHGEYRGVKPAESAYRLGLEKGRVRSAFRCTASNTMIAHTRS